MNGWLILAIAAMSLSAAGILYLVSRICRFPLIRSAAGGSRAKRILLSSALAAALCLALYFALGLVNFMICILHIAGIWLLTELASFIIRKIRRTKNHLLSSENRSHLSSYPAGVFAILLSAAYLAFGWYTAHHVVKTEYLVETGKDLGGESLRIIMFADSHVGATFHADGFSKITKEMEALSPDLVVIVGDFIDDETSLEDMVGCCKALGELKTRYGTFFAYGNHDRGYRWPKYRGYGDYELRQELEKNGVQILQDKALLIDERFYLIGREDAFIPGRADIAALTEGLDPEKYQIVLDHQPHDYDAEEKSRVDMVLSGHTHGGWLFPVNKLAEWNGTDDKTYGLEKRSDTTFIVTSGISEWALKFKTGTVSEYVVIDIV